MIDLNDLNSFTINTSDALKAIEKITDVKSELDLLEKIARKLCKEKIEKEYLNVFSTHYFYKKYEILSPTEIRIQYCYYIDDTKYTSYFDEKIVS